MKMVFIKALSGQGSFLTKLYSLAVIDQMKIHGILSAKGIVRCDGISNFTMRFNGLFVQNASCCFDKKRNRTVDYGNQSGDNNIFAA